MTIAQRRQKLQTLLYLVKHKQVYTAAEVAKQLHCHVSTVEKLFSRLRKDGYQITYDKSLRRYVLVEES